MLKRLRGQEISAWDQGILTEICANPPPGLRELLARSLTAAFPERAGKDEKLSRRIDNAFLDAAYFYQITAPGYPATAPGYPITAPGYPGGPGGAGGRGAAGLSSLACRFPEHLPPGIDFLNLGHERWCYPAEPFTEDRRSFPEIYADALRGAVDSLLPSIGEYLATGLFPIGAAARRIGNTSLSITDREGRPCAPQRTCPLPLGAVMALT
jgi:hypothetical protein